MTERPLLMTGPLILATLNDSKTQTRRLPTSATSLVDGKRVSPKAWKALDLDWDHAKIDGAEIRLPEHRHSTWHTLVPIWDVGDHLWLRETLRNDDGDWVYQADDRLLIRDGPEEWRRRASSKGYIPSIHMPRWASRIDLEVLAVRAERVQEIDNMDALAEGACIDWRTAPHDPISQFHTLWDSINAARGCAWKLNRPVFVLTYKRIKP